MLNYTCTCFFFNIDFASTKSTESVSEHDIVKPSLSLHERVCFSREFSERVLSGTFLYANCKINSFIIYVLRLIRNKLI